MVLVSAYIVHHKSYCVCLDSLGWILSTVLVVATIVTIVALFSIGSFTDFDDIEDPFPVIGTV